MSLFTAPQTETKRELMKTKILLWLSLVIKVASFLTGLAAIPAISMIPPQFMSYALVVFAGASIVKDTSNRIGDLLDDGILNGSWKHGVGLLLAACLPFTAVSCANDAFLGVNKGGWAAIGRDALTGALKGAAGSALPAYAREKEAATSAKTPVIVTP